MNFAVIVANRVVDAADVSLFPSMYKPISQEFQIGPHILGQILLAQTIARSISSPIWGFLADRLSKRKLLSCGCFIWGISTIGSGFSTLVSEFFIWRIICGIGLGCVSPIMQSLIAENSQDDQIGRAFGLLSIAGMVGSAFGVLLGTNLSNWRLPFYIVGSISIVLGYFDLKLINESGVVHNKNGFSASQITSEVYQIFKKKTILIIMLQGVIGTVPWIALSFMTLFFQSIGFTNYATTFLTMTFGFGAGFGGYIGGLIGDAMNSLFPYRGRVYTAQMSVFLGIPLVWIIFGILDPIVGNYYFYWLSLLILGLVCSWCSTGCNRPLFIDVVPAELRSTAISWVVAVDDSLAGLAAPVVGLLAENYGYIKTDVYNAEIYATNAEALQKSLYQTTTYPWFFVFYLIHSYTILCMRSSKSNTVNRIKCCQNKEYRAALFVFRAFALFHFPKMINPSRQTLKTLTFIDMKFPIFFWTVRLLSILTVLSTGLTSTITPSSVQLKVIYNLFYSAIILSSISNINGLSKKQAIFYYAACLMNTGVFVVLTTNIIDLDCERVIVLLFGLIVNLIHTAYVAMLLEAVFKCKNLLVQDELPVYKEFDLLPVYTNV